MFPVKLTENRYLNPEAAADIEFTPKGVLCEDAFFTVLFLNNQLLPIQLKGSEADEAFANWKATHDERRKQAESDRDRHSAKSSARSFQGKSE